MKHFYAKHAEHKEERDDQWENQQDLWNMNDEKQRAVEPLERIKNFNEFHISAVQRGTARVRAARCMDCGVPVLSVGHDDCRNGYRLSATQPGTGVERSAVYTGNYEQAYNRLHKTNNFPEFTSRVCPALCEAACTCGH